MFQDSDATVDLLGDGHHPAPQRGRDRQGDRQRRAAAGQHRQARRRPVPGARALQRAGRPHDGHLGAAAGALPRRAAGGVRLRPAARARPRHGAGDRGAARRRGQGLHRDGRQLRLGRARHRGHRAGDAQRRPDRARLHQAQPLARRHRPRGADPAGAGPQRARPHRRPAPAGHGRGLDVGRARLARPAGAGVAAPEVRGRHRLLARDRHARRPARHPVGRSSAPTTPRSGTGSPGWCRAARRTTRRSASRAASCCRTRRATRGPSRPRPARRSSPTSPTDVLHVPEGRLLLQTMRSHDQFNTTIYGLDDRYRGIKNGRRVVFVHPDDIAALGLADGAIVDLVSEWADGSERRAPEFRVVPYDQPRGCAAAYYPETNPLVPLGSTAIGSNCPTSKSVIVRLEPPRRGAGRRRAERRRHGHRPVTTKRHRRAGAPVMSNLEDKPAELDCRDRAGRRRRDHDAARRPARRAAGDAGPPYPAAAAAVADRRLVLRRPLRSRRRRRHRRHGRPAAPAHRAADGELAVHRRGRAPRQRRPPRDGAARRGEPDDRRPRHQPLRGVARRRPRRCTARSSGSRCRTPTGTSTPASPTTRRRR